MVSFDEFSRKLLVAAAPPWDPGTKSRLWTDNDDVQLQRWLQAQNIPVQRVKTVTDAVRAVARHFDALVDYLDNLKWDGAKRLTTWLTQYLGIEDNLYTRTVGLKFLVSAVARALDPGCQADHVLVLEGPQGIGKSKAVRILGGGWTKENLPDLHSKDAVVELQGSWIVELSELSAMNRSVTEAVKSFITRRIDRYREPYGRHPVEQPRRCVFVATTNEERYLKDTTGNRRFWPVKVTAVDFDALERDRDQLWAEALRKYRAGTKWHLTQKNVIRKAEIEQAIRVEDDPWTPLIAHYLDAREQVSTRQLLMTIGIDPDRLTGGHAKRIGGIMRRWRWESYVDKSGGGRDVIWTPRGHPKPAKGKRRKHVK